MEEMLNTKSVSKALSGLGFERIETVDGATYKDSSTVIIVPTRGLIHHKVVASWQNLITPMNQKRAMIFAVGDEVGIAYNKMVEMVMAHPELSKWKYIMTMEDDNIQPPDAHVRLLESIGGGNYDGVSGIYFTKGDINMPMCYGDASEYSRTGVLDFKPLDVRRALNGGNVMDCNGIAMGCSLFRMELFRQIPSPWFVSVADVFPEKGAQCFTQDLFFCEKAKRMGKRFGVDFRVRVGHVDVQSGVVY